MAADRLDNAARFTADMDACTCTEIHCVRRRCAGIEHHDMNGRKWRTGDACPTCSGTGLVAATPGQPGDGYEACPACGPVS